MDTFEYIKNIGVIPVVVLNKIEDTEDVLKGLSDGDVKVAEICFRTECASDCIKLAVSKFPDVLVGAGTVINKTQAKKAIKDGAKFIVSPGLSKEVAKVCKKNNIPYFPGVVTPSEIMEAIKLGYSVLKFFPAGVYGGLKAIKALGAAFPSVKFIPTGGVNNDNLAEFVSCDKVFAIGGSFLVGKSYEETLNSCIVARKIIKGEN